MYPHVDAAWDLPGIDVCREMTVVVYSSRSQQITLEDYGLKLYVQEGSLPASMKQCTIDIKVSLAGQYEFLRTPTWSVPFSGFGAKLYLGLADRSRLKFSTVLCQIGPIPFI